MEWSKPKVYNKRQTYWVKKGAKQYTQLDVIRPLGVRGYTVSETRAEGKNKTSTLKIAKGLKKADAIKIAKRYMGR